MRQYQQHMCNNILMFATQGRCVWLNMLPKFRKSCNHQKGTERSRKRFYVCLYICMKVCVLGCVCVCIYAGMYCMYACTCVIEKHWPPEKMFIAQIFRWLSWPQDASRNCTHLSSKRQKKETEKNISRHKNNKSVFMWKVNVAHRVLG